MTASSATTSTTDENNGWMQVPGEKEDLLVKVLRESAKGADARVVEKGMAVLLNLQGWYVNKDDTPELDFKRDTASITSQSSRLLQSFEGWLVMVGANDLVTGVDLGLTILQEGQTAYIYCPSEYALGSGTRKYKDCSVPANATVLYQVSITAIVQDTSRLNPYFTIQKALTRKKIANDLYQHECSIDATRNKQAHHRALLLYRTVGQDMKGLLSGTYFASVEPNHPQRTECQQIMMDCYNNIVVLYLQTKEYSKALEAVDVALQRTNGLPFTNYKALVRRAKICVHLAQSPQKCSRAQHAITAARDALGFSHETERAELNKMQALLDKRQEQIHQAAS